MEKDTRTRKQRVADGKRQEKEHLNSVKRRKITALKKISSKKDKISQELAFQRHMNRLKGELAG